MESTIILVLVAVFLCSANCQLYECPADAASCCKCQKNPGCTWSTPVNESQSRCMPDPDFISRTINELIVSSNANRPFNPHRKRFLRPQSGRLTMSMGLRKEIPINVLATSRRMRLIATGSADGPEFTIEKGDGFSCVRRFNVRARILRPRRRRTRSARRGGRSGRGRGGGGRSSRRSRNRNTQQVNRGPQKKITIECHVSGAGEIQKLNLIIDMNKCYQSPKEIRLNVRESGSRRFRLQVRSDCTCPCRSPWFSEVDDDDDDDNDDSIDECRQRSNVVRCVSNEDNSCSGVNNLCRRNQSEATCSGHGTCICGQCVCDFIQTQDDRDADAIEEPAIILDGVEPAERFRYSGSYCQCNDFSCPRYNELLCGGPDKGLCQCGRCVCKEGFQGDDCSMGTNDLTCMSPDGSVCSDQGDCITGRCVCHEGYWGALCDHCPSCQNSCGRFASCVECLAFGGVESNDQVNCTSVCPPVQDPPIRFVLSDTSPEANTNFCIMQRNGCSYEFTYTTEDNGGTVVHYHPELHCH